MRSVRFGWHRGLLNGQKQFKLGRQLVLRVKSVREVDPPDAAIGVDLHAKRFDVIGSVGSPREVGQIELDLIPALVESHRHRADEWLDASGGLVVAGTEASAHIFIVQHLNAENEEEHKTIVIFRCYGRQNYKMYKTQLVLELT